MTQLEIYKEALIVMRDARVLDVGYWEFEYKFSGLCTLILRISDSLTCDRPAAAEKQFVRDSERILGRELPEYDVLGICEVALADTSN